MDPETKYRAMDSAATVAIIIGIAAISTGTPLCWIGILVLSAVSYAGVMVLIRWSGLSGEEPTTVTRKIGMVIVGLLALSGILTPICLVWGVKYANMRPAFAALGMVMISAILLRMPVFKNEFALAESKGLVSRIISFDLSLYFGVALLLLGIYGLLVAAVVSGPGVKHEVEGAAEAVYLLGSGVIILIGTLFIVSRINSRRSHSGLASDDAASDASPAKKVRKSSK